LSVSRSDQILYLLLGHAFAHCTINRLVGAQRNLRRQTHERDLVGAFDHAATGGDGVALVSVS